MALIAVVCFTYFTCGHSAATNLSQHQGNASISGQVYDNRFGLPVSGATVTVRSEGGAQWTTTTDAGGGYEIKNLPEGQSRVAVDGLGFTLMERSVETKKGEAIVLDLPLRIGRLHDPIPISINGTVVLKNKTPAAGAMISVISPFGQETVAKTKTNQSGEYVVKVDEPGQYILYAGKSGFEVGVLSIILRPTLPREQFRADFTLNRLTLR